MAAKSKAELREEIAALAAAKDVAIDVGALEEMNHLDLSALLGELEAKTPPDGAAGDQPAAGDQASTKLVAGAVRRQPASNEPPGAPPDMDAKTSPLTAPPTPTVDGRDDRSLGGPPKASGVKYRWPYSVAQGRSVTTRQRGTVPAFGRVRADDFPGGQATLDELVASGHVVKQP